MGDLTSAPVRLDQAGPLENRSSRAHRGPVHIRLFRPQPVQQLLRTPPRPLALGLDQPLRDRFLSRVRMRGRSVRALDQSLPPAFLESLDRLVARLPAHPKQLAQLRHLVAMLQVHLHKLSSLLHPVGLLPHLLHPFKLCVRLGCNPSARFICYLSPRFIPTSAFCPLGPFSAPRFAADFRPPLCRIKRNDGRRSPRTYFCFLAF